VKLEDEIERVIRRLVVVSAHMFRGGKRVELKEKLRSEGRVSGMDVSHTLIQDIKR